MDEAHELIGSLLLAMFAVAAERDAARAKAMELEGARLMAMLEVDNARRAMLGVRDILRRVG